MIDFVLIVLLLSAFLYYLSFLQSIWRGLSSLSFPTFDYEPHVSVIVPTRNEERNVDACLGALLNQSYDPKKVEVIVVDDHSTDRTTARAQQFSGSINGPVVRVLFLSRVTGKAGAIAHGISEAKGDIILCTDADCIVPQHWIGSMVRCFAPSVAFVAGPVLERPTNNLLSVLQSVEYLGLTTTGAGLIGSGQPIICSGANIAYRKSAFLSVNGFGEHHSACDDETLMQRMILRNVGSVTFNADANATVTTSTPQSLAAFWQQRTRWASKRGRYEDPSIVWKLVLVYCFFLLTLISALLAIVDPLMRIPVMAVVLLKVIVEFLILSKGSRLFHFPLPRSVFVIAELFHVPYIAIAGLVGQFTSLRWKDRNLNQ
jgi:poly-beta-1,6-N-acetyl-D-glucosamine synthase